MVDASGETMSPHEAVFPIIKTGTDGVVELVGTGFFLSDNGVFATAKHVVMDVIDAAGQPRSRLDIVHFLPGDKYLQRQVLQLSIHQAADVAIGGVAPMAHNRTGEALKNRFLGLTVEIPSVGEGVATYAYPLTMVEHWDRGQTFYFEPAYYEGRLEEIYERGRDKVLLPGRCCRTTMPLYGGASGGPVVGLSGLVFGINSTGYDGLPEVSYVSCIADIVTLPIQDANVPWSERPTTVTITELAQRGYVKFAPSLR
jgi:hypothetical protein